MKNYVLVLLMSVLIISASCSPGGSSSGDGAEAVCGNGILEDGEECDGTDMGNATCASLGYGDGDLECTSECRMDTSGCTGNGTGNNANSGGQSVCGNGVLEDGEECDGSDLGGATCQSMGFTGGGELSCTASCTLDTSGCFGTTCGNGVADDGEECDGNDLKDLTCTDLGYVGGTLRCSDTCTLDESGCTNDDVQAVCERWNDDLSSAQSGQWTGDVNSCDPGDYLAPGRDSALKLTNLYRWLAGLSPVVEDADLDRKAQACALIQHARGGLTHFPQETDPCYTADGADAAQHSNIATANAVEAVHMYISDFGNEDTMGHRRWILSNWYTRAGFGSTSSYSCQWVINGLGGSGPEWTAFPSPGVFPYQAMHMSYRSVDEVGWTIQSDSIRVGEATIRVYEDGVEKPVNVYDITGGNYGSFYAVRFTPDGWSSSPGHTYTVEVSGISQPFSYDVIMVDCTAVKK